VRAGVPLRPPAPRDELVNTDRGRREGSDHRRRRLTGRPLFRSSQGGPTVLPAGPGSIPSRSSARRAAEGRMTVETNGTAPAKVRAPRRWISAAGLVGAGLLAGGVLAGWAMAGAATPTSCSAWVEVTETGASSV